MNDKQYDGFIEELKKITEILLRMENLLLIIRSKGI